MQGEIKSIWYCSFCKVYRNGPVCKADRPKALIPPERCDGWFQCLFCPYTPLGLIYPMLGSVRWYECGHFPQPSVPLPMGEKLGITTYIKQVLQEQGCRK